jgi:hypothetical protein
MVLYYKHAPISIECSEGFYNSGTFYPLGINLRRIAGRADEGLGAAE